MTPTSLPGADPPARLRGGAGQIVVIAVLGILSLILVPQFSLYGDKAMGTTAAAAIPPKSKEKTPDGVFSSVKYHDWIPSR